ncbi:thioredoxin [Gordonia hirsuta DSM 44140 = NBRC 16056]|uniref:Thioredoxin n=1 Tax=Gordonia hirsuta DSM 44140 = NBRC 16056 TaxID=1121927 RepID=L7LBH2_9ACTN|nr:thioredoxin [Gordonia hirsuta DSM 44140 = NBRC 16056]
MADLGNHSIGEVLRSERPSLVYFWAPWCTRCRAFTPQFEQFADDHGDKVQLRRVNASDEDALVSSYRVTGLPTLLLFDGGTVVQTITDPSSKEDLEDRLAPYL